MVNMTDPTRDAEGPNSRDRSEIVMGYTHESPKPARLALATTASSECDATSPAIPEHAVRSPACTSRVSSMFLSNRGATHLPSIRAE